MSSPVPPPATSTPAARPNAGPTRQLTTWQILMLVVAAAAPLAAMIGNVPVGLILGNGAGLPAAYLIAGIVLACFVVGYLAMSRDIPEAGAFYAYVRAGLGRGAGLGTAYASLLSYTAATLNLATAFGYFGDLIGRSFGLHLGGWPVYTAIGLLLTGLLGQRSADLSAKVLFTLMIAEFALLTILDVSILAAKGLGSLPTASFAPSHAFGSGLGVSLMIGFTSFVGIESAALYVKEARDPRRGISRATYGAIAVIAVFYVMTCWIIVGALGADQAQAVAAKEQGDLLFGLSDQFAGSWLTKSMEAFFCTSLLACLLALHSVAARYLQTLAAEGNMPGRLAPLHQRYGVPHLASRVVTVISVVVLGIFALAGADPFIGLGTALGGLFTIGIIAMQALVSIAAIAYFRRARDPRRWTTLVAPAIGAAGLITAAVLIVLNYSTLTATDNILFNSLPALIPIAILTGFVIERRRRPGRLAPPVSGGGS